MRDCEFYYDKQEQELGILCLLGQCTDRYNQRCSDNGTCYYKQLLAEQAKNKKLVEALELIMNNDDEPTFENYTATQALLANEVNKC